MVAQTLNAHQLPLPEGATGLAPETILVTSAAAGAPRESVVTAGRLCDSCRRRAQACRHGPLPPDACDAHFARVRPPRSLSSDGHAALRASRRDAAGRGHPAQDAWPDARRAGSASALRQQSRCHVERHRGRARTRSDGHCGRRSRHRHRHARAMASRGHRRRLRFVEMRAHRMAAAIPAASASMPLRCWRRACGLLAFTPSYGPGRVISRNGCRICCGRRCLLVLDHMAAS